MSKLLLPLNCYDEAGRIKPPRFFWWCCLFLAKSYFIFILSLSNFRDADQLLYVFYPNQSELYTGLAIGFSAVVAMILVAYREKWWNGRFRFVVKLIKPCVFVAITLDLVHQIQLAEQASWGFSWSVSVFILLDLILLYWLIKSRHIKYMLLDWSTAVHPKSKDNA